MNEELNIKLEFISDITFKYEASLKEIIALKAKIVELDNLIKNLRTQVFDYENKIAMLSSEISRMKKLTENRQNSFDNSNKLIEELEANKRILVDRVITIFNIFSIALQTIILHVYIHSYLNFLSY